MSNYDDLIAQLEGLAQQPPEDAAARARLFEALRPAVLAVESGLDVFGRVGFAALQTCVSKVAVDLKLFSSLADANGPLTLAELSERSGAQPLLLGRILRYMSAGGLVKECGTDTFAASTATRVLAHPGFSAGINHMYDIEIPCWMALPKFLAENDYKVVQDPCRAPFGKAFNTDLHAFAWGAQHPEIFKEFQLFLSAYHEDAPNWLDVFPRSSLEAEGSEPLLIDIGGGRGHQCALLKQRYPDNPRKVVLQDQPHVIPTAIPTSGVEAQAYDFFTPQPVHGASFYYIKNCLHDWSDENVAKILENQKSALAKDSAILIDEMILPDAQVHWQATNMDMLIMCNSAALERTEAHWKLLVESCGLVVKEKYTYNHSLHHGVLVVGLP